MGIPLASPWTPDQVELAARRRWLLEFIKGTYPGYEAGWFAAEVCAELDWFLRETVAGRAPRLMLFAPPRSGKSEIVSRRFPAFALGKYPNLRFIATSYGGGLAAAMNRDVQRVIDTPEYRAIFPGIGLSGKNIKTSAHGNYVRNSEAFEIVNFNGGYKCAGVGGGITGLGGDILQIDDPIKDAEQANSPVYREKVWEWYTSTFYTRKMPGAGILIILTRWHEDDLAGRLLRQMENGDGDQWKVVSFPAIAEKDEYSSITGKLLRREGEALHPERYPLEELEAIKVAVGGRVWASLYQQRPAAAEGSIFKRDWWRYYKTPEGEPADIIKALGITSVVQFWDTGFKTGQDNDPSVCITLGTAENRYMVLDRWKQKVEFPDLKRALPVQHAKWKPSVVLVEDKASGQSLIQEMKRETRIPIIPIPVDRDKVARANAVTPMLEAGLVYLPEDAPWVSDFVDELATFPNAAHDDQVDAFDGALEYSARGGGGMGFFEWLRRKAEERKAKKDESVA
jgi:predicted phage terminase large subunit-like protein